MDDKPQNDASQLTAAQQAIMAAKAARRAAMASGAGTAAPKSAPAQPKHQPQNVHENPKPAAASKQRPPAPMQRPVQRTAQMQPKPAPQSPKRAVPAAESRKSAPQSQPAVKQPPTEKPAVKPTAAEKAQQPRAESRSTQAEQTQRNIMRSGVLEQNSRVFETAEIELPAKAKAEKAVKTGGANIFTWQKLLLCLSVVVFAVSAFFLLQYYISTGIEKKNLENISAAVITAQSSDDGTQSADALILQQYAALAAQNSDMIGWISIDGTTVNAPVMHTPGSPEYYLTHDFEKKYSQSGMLFMDASCIPDSQAGNMIIYGHNMKNKTMFSDIESYTNAEFLAQHPVIQFDTLNARGQYQVFAVFELDTSEGNENSMQCYYYSNTADAAKHAYFLDYVRQYASAVVDDKLPDSGDTLITLSTCDNVTPNGRVVVMAKKVLSAAPSTEVPAQSTAESTSESIS